MLKRLLIVLVLATPVFAAPLPARSPGLKKAYADLKSPAFATRLAAIEALTAARDAGAVDAILPALRDEDPTVRWGACDALEKLADPRAITSLQATRNDASPWVADRARQAVKALTQDTIGRPSGALAIKTVGVDRSGCGVAGLDEELARAASTAMGAKQVKIISGLEEPSHVITVQLTTVKENGTQLEIAGTATVTEEGNLRFATRVGAAIEVSGKLSPAKLAELAKEGTRAIGQRLGEESADWLRQPH